MTDLGYNGFPVLLNYFEAPDYTALHNTAVAVVFKQLSKKTAVTREKSLLELRTLVTTGLDWLDAALVRCWLQIYPKLALDNSRAVRSESHAVQGAVLQAVGGKSFSPFLKLCVPVWLQGLFDTERAVLAAAQALLAAAFGEKTEKLWLLFAEQIANYIHNVVCAESAELLLDPRSVLQDDAHAKYSRALNGAVAMLTRLVAENAHVNPDVFVRVWDALAYSGGANVNLALFRNTLLFAKMYFGGDFERAALKAFAKRFVEHVRFKGDLFVAYSRVVTPMWEALTCATTARAKKNFWDYAGKKAAARLAEYLKAGPCMAGRGYFEALPSFFEALKAAPLETPLLDFDSEKDAAFVLVRILASQAVKVRPYSDKIYVMDCVAKVSALFLKPPKKAIFCRLLDGVSNGRGDKVACLELLKLFAVDILTELVDTGSCEGYTFVSHKGDVLVNYALVCGNDTLMDKLAENGDPSVYPALAVLAQRFSTPAFETWLDTLPSRIAEPGALLVFEAVFKKGTVDDLANRLLKECAIKGNQADVLAIEDEQLWKLPAAQSALLELAKKENRTREENEVAFKHIANPDVLSAVADSSASDPLTFINAVMSQDVTLERTEKLEVYVVEALQVQPKADAFLQKLGADFVKSVVWTSFKNRSIFEWNEQAYGFLKENPNFFPADIMTELEHVLDIDLELLEVENPLGAAVHLISNSGSSSSTYEDICANLRFARHFHSSGIFACRKDDFTSLESEEPGSIENSADGDIEEYSRYISGTGPFTIGHYYRARVLHNHLLKENITIEEDSLIKHPLKLAVFVSAGKVSSARVTNHVFSQLLGSNDPYNGKMWLALSVTLLGQGQNLIPEHKMAMTVKHLESWLDSEVAYEPDFVAIRQLLAQFAIGLLTRYPGQFDAFATELCSSNVATMEVEPSLGLLRWTLELVSVLPAETKRDLFKEILDSIETMAIPKTNVAAPIVAALRHLSTIELPISFLDDKAPQLYSHLFSTHRPDLQLFYVAILQKYILSKQEALVVEFTLKTFEPELPPILLENHESLWSWLLIFAHFENTPHGVRAAYGAQIKKSGYLGLLLDSVMDIAADYNRWRERNSEKIDVFDAATVNFNHRFMDVMLVHLYFKTLAFLGSQAQLWFSEIRSLEDKRSIEALSKNHVCPLLTSQMLDQVEAAKPRIIGSDTNLTIKVNRATNEIRSVYVIDEQTMEMVVKIPETFPLALIAVSGPLRLGVKEKQWRAWLLALQRVVTLANGLLIDCIELFKRNVTLHFSGFEDCAICYSILHQDHSLPSKACPTCLNKFHAACLYKWFKTSASSTCPLCRSAFSFN